MADGNEDSRFDRFISEFATVQSYLDACNVELISNHDGYLNEYKFMNTNS